MTLVGRHIYLMLPSDAGEVSLKLVAMILCDESESDLRFDTCYNQLGNGGWIQTIVRSL